MTIAERIADTEEQLRKAAEQAGIVRAPTLVAVSKRHPVEKIREARLAGHRDFGENFAQELSAKASELAGDDEIRWHFIGRLQRNKAKSVVGTAELIHAVDSERLLIEIDRCAARIGVCQDVLLAVNVAASEAKSGLAVADLDAHLEIAAELSSVRCVGLMTMPPLPKIPEHSRPHFRKLRELRDLHRTEDNPLRELSMGSSGDCEVAVSEAATLIRVGTAVFGPRSS